MITCSLSAYNDRETLSTLRFGNRAKSIKNKVVQNAERSAKELLVALNEAESRIEKITEVVTLLQGKLRQLIKEAPTDIAEAYKALLEDTKGVSTASDLDFLLMKLKGTAEEVLEGIDDEEEEKAEQLPTLAVPSKISKASSAKPVTQVSLDDDEPNVITVEVVSEAAIKKALAS